MPQPRSTREQSWPVTFVVVILVVAVLSIAREVLIPLALALLLSFLLAPISDRLEHWKLGRFVSVMIVAVLSFALIGAIGSVVAVQMIELAEKVPLYQDNISQKIQALRAPGDGPFSRATESIKQLSREILRPPPEPFVFAPAAENEPAQPIPVQVVDEPLQPVQAILQAAGPALRPLVSAGIVIVFVVFMLLQRDELRDRVIRLIGQGRLTVATQAIDDAARRVSRYLLMQLTINTTYGLAAGIGLYFIGIPNAVLWGVLATLLRFIPYVGPWLGALLPILLALAAFDTWTPVLLTIGLFIVIELISNNVMEPWLYGSRTGISPVAILASAVFWAWLWGPVGLVLATPLTVCVVVMGRYIPRLEFLSVLLSDQPGLSLSARLYQRLLAMDQDDIYEISETYLADHSLLELYDDVLLPALSLAERDRHQGTIEVDREEAVYQSLRDLIEELGMRREEAPETRPLEEVPQGLLVLCLPARDVADEIASLMLSQVLAGEGARVEVVPAGKLVTEVLDYIDQRQPDVVCLSAMPPQAITRTRHLCQRLTERFANLRLVVGYWNASDLTHIRQRLPVCAPEGVVRHIADVIDLMQRQAV